MPGPVLSDIVTSAGKKPVVGIKSKSEKSLGLDAIAASNILRGLDSGVIAPSTIPLVAKLSSLTPD